MALMNNNQTVDRPGQRNTAMMLVRSGKTSPAVKYILSDQFTKDPTLKTVYKEGVLFEHKWGGPLNKDVVIPMGRIVAAGKPVKNFQMNEYNTQMTLPGLTTNKNWIGVVPFNITTDFWQKDRMGGNQPAVITDKLLVLPYIPGAEASENRDLAGVVEEETNISVNLKMPWGAVINPHGQAGPLAYTGGDYLMSSASGRFVKWDGTNPMDIVAQIYEIDLNQTPHGFLKWVLWDEQAFLEDAPYNKGNMPDYGGYGYDPEYNEGKLRASGYLTDYTTPEDATGIPGLHDGTGAEKGFGIRDTNYEKVLVDDSVSGSTGETLVLQIKDIQGKPVKEIIPGSTTVYVDDAVLEDAVGTYSIDHANGKLKLTLASDITNKNIKITYKMERRGIPSYLDFKGVAGSMTVLLLK